MTNNTMNHQAIDNQDHLVLMSQLYPDVYTQIVPQQQQQQQQQGESKRKRRRKKNKNSETGTGGAKKRKLTDEQVNMLEINFGNEHKLDSERKDRLAAELGLDPRQVAVWFQNRRARWKNQKLEEEYSNIKKSHETVVVEKCQLESEVLKLKEQLLEAEKKIQRLSERVDHGAGSSNSPSSSLSMEITMEPAAAQFLGDQFGVEGYNDVFYMPETNYIFGMEWPHLYM